MSVRRSTTLGAAVFVAFLAGCGAENEELQGWMAQQAREV